MPGSAWHAGLAPRYVRPGSSSTRACVRLLRTFLMPSLTMPWRISRLANSVESAPWSAQAADPEVIDRIPSGYSHFVIPFTVGITFLLCWIGVGCVRLLAAIPKEDRLKFWKSLFLPKTIVKNLKDLFGDCLFHVKIFLFFNCMLHFHLIHFSICLCS